MKIFSCIALCAAAAVASTISCANAFYFEYRVVERVNGADVVLPGNRVTVRPGSAHVYRVQFRVVPEGPGEVLGGFLGWNVGTITSTGGVNTRTAIPPNPNPRGRLAPFTFAAQACAEGCPAVDPFTSLTQVDATLGFWTFEWGCDANGPLPQPQAPVLGRGNFVSVFEFTSVATGSDHTFTIGGNLIASDAWADFACPPPDCGLPNDPSDDKPSSCQRTPRPTPPRGFSMVFEVNVCSQDWNDDGAVNSQDVFAFFADFFGGAGGDVNGDGQLNSRDVFAFLNEYFVGC